MRGKMMFLGGLAVGFVLGARAGRETYEELVVWGRKILDHPTVQEAAGVAQAQANRFYHEGRDKLGQSRLGDKLGGNGQRRGPTAADNAFAGTPATVGAASGPSSTGSASRSSSGTGSTSGSPSSGGTSRAASSGAGSGTP